MPKKEFYKQTLLRSQSNYFRLFDFYAAYKTYKVKLDSSLLSKNAYVRFFYMKGKDIRINLSENLVTNGVDVSIKDGKINISPKAPENEIPAVLLNIVFQICEIFIDGFYEQFADAKIVSEGKHITYSKNGFELTLNADTALI